MVKKKKGGNPNPKTEHLKKTQLQNIDTSKAQAIRKQGAKASNEIQKEKKIEEKENKKLADIFGLILQSEIKSESARSHIKSKYPDVDLNNKSLIAVETFARMFGTMKIPKTIKEKDENGKETTRKELLVIKTMKDSDFLNYQEYIRNTIGEKPVDEVNTNQINFNVDVSKKDLKEAGKNLKKMLEDNNI